MAPTRQQMSLMLDVREEFGGEVYYCISCGMLTNTLNKGQTFCPSCEEEDLVPIDYLFDK